MRYWLYKIRVVVDVVAETEEQALALAWTKASRMGDLFNANIEHQPDLEKALIANETVLLKHDL